MMRGVRYPAIALVTAEVYTARQKNATLTHKRLRYARERNFGDKLERTARSASAACTRLARVDARGERGDT